MLGGFCSNTSTFCWNAYKGRLSLAHIPKTAALFCLAAIPLEANLLHHRSAGIRDGPFFIKADRKPGNWDGAQVRYYKADFHSLRLLLSTLSLQLLYETEEQLNIFIVSVWNYQTKRACFSCFYSFLKCRYLRILLSHWDFVPLCLQAFLTVANLF